MLCYAEIFDCACNLEDIMAKKNAAKARSFAAGGQRSIAAKTGTSFFLLQADEDIVPQIVVQTHVERGSVIQIRFENAFEKAELVFGHL